MFSCKPFTVYNYDFFFNCTTVDQASDSAIILTLSFNQLVGAKCLSLGRPNMAQVVIFCSSDYL